MFRSFILFIKKHYLVKVVMLYVCILFCTVSVLSVTIYFAVRTDTIAYELDSTDIMLRNICNYFNSKQVLVSKILMKAHLDNYKHTEALEYMEIRKEADNNRYIELGSKFNDFFYSMFSQDEDIVSIAIYKKLEQAVYLYTRNNFSTKKDAKSYIYADRLVQTNDISAKTQLYSSYAPFYLNDGDYVYTFAANIKRLGTNIITGLFAVDFNASGIEPYLKTIGARPKGILVVINQEGALIYHSAKQYSQGAHAYKAFIASAPGAEIIFNGEKSIINTYTDTNTGITAINIIPATEALSNVKKLASLTLRIMLLCLFASVLLTALLVWLFSNRIKLIISCIKKVRRGSLDVRIPIKENEDELSEISIAFNEMCDHLNQYIQKVYIAEINRKNAELNQKNAQLKTLQSQINPHFLYNAMEVIRMKAVNEQCNEVADMIVSLSRLFRNSIKTDNIISIEEEIQYSTSYLRIFEACYQDNLKVIFNIEKEILQVPILKHLIHPILENYIMHGFILENDRNVINIKAFQEGCFIIFHIIDNGKGITDERLAEIRKSLRNTESSENRHIGLVNVNQRIKLVYGQTADWKSKAPKAKELPLSYGFWQK